jgi:site-specific DNA recombinase
MLPVDRPPHGYKVIRDGNLWKLEIVESEAHVVRMLYEWYVYGDENGKSMTLRAIAQRLTDSRIPTPLDNKIRKGINAGRKKRAENEWSGTTIAHYLDREVYKGTWVYGRKSEEPISVQAPAIVSVELWERARKIRKLKYVENIKVRKYSYLFARRIRCGLCSSVVVGTPVNGYLYYRCLALKKGKVIGVNCNAPHFKLEIVETVVWEWIKSLLSDPQALQQGLDERMAETESHINPFRERLEVVEKLLHQYDRELDRALELYISGNFPKEVLLSRKSELETALQSLEQEKLRLVEVIEDHTISPAQIESIHDFAGNIRAGLDEADQDFRKRRSIVDTLDVRVVLSVEDGQKVVYAQCSLGEREFMLSNKTSPSGKNSSGEGFRNTSTQNCAGCLRKNQRRMNHDSGMWPRGREGSVFLVFARRFSNLGFHNEI